MAHAYATKAVVDGDNPKNPSDISTGHEALHYTSQWLNDKKTQYGKKKTILVNRSLNAVKDNAVNWLPDPNSFGENIVFTNSAGNKGFYQTELDGIGGFHGKRRSIFVVGNIARNSLPALDSSSGSGVVLSTPSDTSNTVCPSEEGGKCRPYNGTSGAAPHLTHAFKAAVEVLPALKRRHLLAIADKTHIKMPFSFENKQKNGLGMVNSYKIWRVVRELERQCRFHESKETCIDEKIMANNLYKFESPLLGASVENLFPQCFGKPSPYNCSNTKERKKLQENFRKLRETAFLFPKSNKLWSTIGCIQQRHGHSVSEKFYKNINRNFKTHPLKEEEFPKSHLFEKISWYKYADPPFKAKILAEAHKKEDAENGYWKIGTDMQQRLLNDVNNARTRYYMARKAVKAAKKMGPLGLPVLEAALSQRFPGLQVEVFNQLELMGPMSSSILNKGLKAKNKTTVEAAIKSALKVNKEALSVFDSQLHTLPKNRKTKAIQEAFKIGETSLPRLRRTLQSKNPESVITAMEVGLNGNQENLTLLQKAMGSSIRRANLENILKALKKATPSDESSIRRTRYKSN